MSTEVTVPSEEAAPQAAVKPQNVVEMETALMDIHGYIGVVRQGQFRGSDSAQIAKLTGFLQDLHKQIYTAYQKEPFVVDAVAQHKAEEEAKKAQAAKDEAELASN